VVHALCLNVKTRATSDPDFFKVDPANPSWGLVHKFTVSVSLVRRELFFLRSGLHLGNGSVS
jgi:hypothetical protein